MLFREISLKPDTFYQILTKSRSGFTFNKEVPIIQFIDETMEEMYGHPDPTTWTRERLWSIKQDIIDKIKSAKENN